MTMDKKTEEELLKKAYEPARLAMKYHPFYEGKIEITAKCPVRNFQDFAIWYTPGVAEPCKDIKQNPERVYDHTSKGNMVAVVSDGTRVLGLGDIGPEAGLPVMEGKALLFKYLGGVDAVPICLATKDPEEIIKTVKYLAPSFGGINLEDIENPKCFEILDRLRKEMDIPVWHGVDRRRGGGGRLHRRQALRPAREVHLLRPCAVAHRRRLDEPGNGLQGRRREVPALRRGDEHPPADHL